MMFVFGAFVLSSDRMLQQFGLGLAVAILLDAVVIRCLIVPAVMQMLGKRAWWLPDGWTESCPRCQSSVPNRTDLRPSTARSTALEPIVGLRPRSSGAMKGRGGKETRPSSSRTGNRDKEGPCTQPTAAVLTTGSYSAADLGDLIVNELGQTWPGTGADHRR